MSVRLAARVDSYVAAMRAASASTTGFSQATTRNLRTVGTQMQHLGRMATTFVSLPLAAAGAFAVKAAVDWESAWAGVTKTVDGTASQMAELEQGLRDMSKEVSASHGEIAAVAEAAGALGVASEDIEFFTRVMIDLGETTDLTSDQAATAIAKMMNVMQTAPEDVDNLGAALVELGNNGASTESQILDMATRIAAAGEIVGLSESDVLGFANALASMGIEAEAGGSAFSRVITEISKAVAQGGDDLDLFAEAAGMSASAFATAFREDPATAIVSFIDGLGAIEAAGGDVFTVLDDLGLSDVRVSRALLSMATSGDLLTESLDQGAEAWAANTALADEAAKRYDTAGARFEIVRNKIVDLFIDLGEMLLPAIEAVVEVIGEMAEAFQKLPAPVQAAVGGFLGLVAAVGPVVFIAGSFIKHLTAIKGALTLMGPAAAKASLAFGAIGLAIFAGFAAYTAFTEEQRETETVTRDTVAALDANIVSLFGVAGAARDAGRDIDGVAVAQEALSLALSEGNAPLADILSTLNITAAETLDVLAQFDDEPLDAFITLGEGIGIPEGILKRFFEVVDGADLQSLAGDVDSFADSWNIDAEPLQFLAFQWLAFNDAVGETDLQAVALEFLNGRVEASGYARAMVLAAEESLGFTRRTGDAMAVFREFGRLMGEAPTAAMASAAGYEVLADAITEVPSAADEASASLGTLNSALPQSEQVMMAASAASRKWIDGVRLFIGEAKSLGGRFHAVAEAVEELETVQASSIDTMSRYQDYLSDVAHTLDEYSSALDTALGGGRDWVRTHYDMAQGFQDFADEITDGEGEIDLLTQGIDANTDAGYDNAGAILDMADGIIAMTDANFAAGKSQEETNAEYQAARTALLDAAEAAGLNRADVEALIDTYGLVPDLVTTAIDLAGDALAQWQIDRYLEKLDEIPEVYATAIGAAMDMGDVATAERILRNLTTPREAWITVYANTWAAQNAMNSLSRVTGRQSAEGRFVPGGSNMITSVAERSGRAGDEVILPLGDPGRMVELLGMSEVGPRVAAAFGNLSPATSGFSGVMSATAAAAGDTYVTNHVQVNMPPGSDGDDVVRALKRWQRRSGPLPLEVR